VALHEVAHSTGHESRLNRDISNPFGSEAYAREELVAEIASYMICGEIGIPHDGRQNAAYVNSWIKQLENHPMEILRAAREADSAMQHVLSRERERNQELGLPDPEDLTAREQAEEFKKMTPETRDNRLSREEDKRDRVYINVPYPEKNEAKAKGARFDADEKSWYIPKSLDIGTAGQLAVKWPRHDPAKARAEAEARRAERGAGPPERTYINVPRAEKDQAKELGARWDGKAGSWFVPAGVNPEPLAARWPPRAPEPKHAGPEEKILLEVPYSQKELAKKAGAVWSKQDNSWIAGPKANMEKLALWLPGQENGIGDGPRATPKEEFAAVLKHMGAKLEGEHPIFDSKPHRIPALDDKKNDASIFYVAHPDGHPAGYAKNNRTKDEATWRAKGYILEPEKKEELIKTAETRQKTRAENQARDHAMAAAKLEAQMKNLAVPAEPTAYMEAKGIKLHDNVFISGKTTCIPIHDAEGKLKSMQYIQPDGQKRFAKGTEKTGCFHAIGGMEGIRDGRAVIVAEGYATGASIHEATGEAVAVAFDAGNLKSAALALKSAFPDKPIVIAGDDDAHLEAEGKENVGRIKALEAARAVGGKAVFPKFLPGELEKNAKLTDFNDMAKGKLGPEGIRKRIASELNLEKDLNRHAAEIHGRTRG
jgi:phage/plasmid primase-like uncharacterized protein